jgi:hypothetical protein
MASAAPAPPSNEEEAIKLIKAKPKHYLDAFNILKKIAAKNILVTKEFETYTKGQQNAIKALQAFGMDAAFMIWYYDNNDTLVCPAARDGYDFNIFKELKRVSAMGVSAMELVKRNNELRPATILSMGGRKKRSRTNRRSRIRRQKRRTSRRY